MQGNKDTLFVELFRDTFLRFGYNWCVWHYQVENGMQAWEFDFWLARISDQVVELASIDC
jgi:hypothetical protein